MLPSLADLSIRSSSHIGVNKLSDRVAPLDGLAGDGWRLTKRAKKRNDEELRDQPVPAGAISFVIENPLDGKLWSLEGLKELIESEKTNFCPTSYCHYGYDYRKRTGFLTSLRGLRLSPACPQKPCREWSSHSKHKRDIRNDVTDQNERNSIPGPLVDVIMEEWIKKTPGKHRLLIDVFAGWGSVIERVNAKFKGEILTYANDIKNRPGNDIELNMFDFDLDCIIQFAKLKLANLKLANGANGSQVAPEETNLAILLWISTPCETYSSAGGNTSRDSGSIEPKTKKAAAFDAMNTKFAEWLLRVC